MAKVFNCGFARVFLYESRTIAAQNVHRSGGESVNKYKSRVFEERFKLFKEQFKENPQFEIKKGRSIS